MPFGCNRFGSQFERVLPASAIGNMFPFNFSGKTDPKGFYIGRDKYGTNILVDLDRRADDKTNSNILILGNSGQGKSYLMKLLLTNLREAGKRVLVLDAEGEYGELAENNGGCCLDLLDGQYMINILEPKVWASEPVEDPDAPEAFRKSSRIGQHIEFNILSYMTHQLLSVGNCVAALDELYLFLDSPVTIEYIRNNMKRVRKKESAMVLASQNIEDFLLPNIREMTKPLFSIPTHQFLFNPGQINPKDYMDALQVEPSEYDLIHGCERGHNLYRCGNERYLLQVIAPEHKAALFGTAGGR